MAYPQPRSACLVCNRRGRALLQPSPDGCRVHFCQILQVARLHCHGKHAANMKLLVQQLEEATGGIVVHRAGGTVLLYRGDSWQRAEGQPRIAEGQQQEEGQDGGGKQQQHQQQQAPPVSDC